MIRSPVSPTSAIRVFLCLLLLSAACGGAAEREPKPAPAAEKDSKSVEHKKATVRIVALKGEYEDHPLTSGLEPLSLFSGNVDKPSSFFALCEKIDELAEAEEIDDVLFD